MKRCVIAGGAGIRSYERIRQSLKPDDYFIFCDSGLKHLPALQVKPDLIVGDFDSWQQPDTETETIVLPREKDDTDSVYAVREAIRRGFGDFLLIGMTGERFDHTFGNVSILLYLDELGKTGKILDDYGEMEIVSRGKAEITDDAAYFSLLNISGTARDIHISGAKYPLDGEEIPSSYQYGISNEVLPGQTATVSVGEGRLLLVKVYEAP